MDSSKTPLDKSSIVRESKLFQRPLISAGQVERVRDLTPQQIERINAARAGVKAKQEKG